MTVREIFAIRARQQKQRNEVRELMEMERADKERRRKERSERSKAMWASRPRAAKVKQEKPQIPDGYMSLKEFIGMTGLAHGGVHRAINRGNLKSLKIGHGRYISMADYEEYKAGQPERIAENARRAARIRCERVAARKAEQGEN